MYYVGRDVVFGFVFFVYGDVLIEDVYIQCKTVQDQLIAKLTNFNIQRRVYIDAHGSGGLNAYSAVVTKDDKKLKNK